MSQASREKLIKQPTLQMKLAVEDGVILKYAILLYYFGDWRVMKIAYPISTDHVKSDFTLECSR